MLGLGLLLGLFSALLGPARTRSSMFDRLQCRNNSHGHKTKTQWLLSRDVNEIRESVCR